MLQAAAHSQLNNFRTDQFKAILPKSSTASPATKKSTRLGEATTQKEAGLIEKKISLLQVSNANGEFNISVHILRQKFDQYVGGNIPNHFEQ